MKRYLLASIALSTVLVGSAFAQAPAPGWNGFYIGGNVGGTLSSGSQGETVVLTPPGGAAGVTNPLVNATQTLSSTGPLGGVQLGWNQQLGNLQLGSLVGGIEGDWAWTDQSEATQNTHFLASTVVVSPAVMSGTTRQDIQWLSTVRGRLGISNGPVFWYATGGLAIGEITSQSALTVTQINPPAMVFGPAAGAGRFDTTLTGWTLGGGVETSLTWLGLPNQWSAKLEYLYVDLGNVTNTVNFPGATAGTVYTDRVKTGINDNIVRVGLNYHF